MMRLNVATQASHAEVDAPWLSLLRPDIARADYLSVLVQTYGFIAPFESACKYTPRVERDVDLYQLSRAGLIAADLLSLGLAPAQVTEIPHCTRITTFRSVAEALGWVYVVERSTLLFDGIRRHLLSHAQWATPCAYLSAYDGRAGENWAAFGRKLDRIGAKPDVADELVTAAHAAFACAKEWFHTPDARRSVHEPDRDQAVTRVRSARG